MRKLLVSLIVLVLLLVGADFVARALAQRAMAGQLTLVAGLDEEPQVDVHGFPFLTQVFSGHYRHLTLTATHVPVDENLTADTVTADVRDVMVSPSELSRLDEIPVSAESVEVSALLGYSTLGAAATDQVGAGQLTFEIGYVDAETVHVTAVTEVLGTTVTGEADAEIRLTGEKLVIDFTEDLFGDVPSRISTMIVSISSIAFPVDLPYGLTANDLTVTTDGVIITATGSQVTLHNP
jgi:hypothetical protein